FCGEISLPAAGQDGVVTCKTNPSPASFQASTLQPEQVHDTVRRIEQNDSPTQYCASPVPRQSGQTSRADPGQGLHTFLQARRQSAIPLEMALQSRREPVFLGESWRQARTIVHKA